MVKQWTRLTCIVVLGATAAFAWAVDELPPVPSIGCPLIAAGDAPKIDGSLDEPIWARAEVQDGYQKVHGGGATSRMAFRILSDGDWLYVGVTVSEPGVRHPTATWPPPQSVTTEPVQMTAGPHTLRLEVEAADPVGVEIDAVMVAPALLGGGHKEGSRSRAGCGCGGAHGARKTKAAVRGGLRGWLRGRSSEAGRGA